MRMQFGDLQPIHDFRQRRRLRTRSWQVLTVRMNMSSAEEAITTKAVLGACSH